MTTATAILVLFSLSVLRAGHWALESPHVPALPRVRDASWADGAIDLFVLARLEAAGRRPAPRAGRRTLIRRLYLDLIGLPPTPEEIREFLDDGHPDAYDRVVDRLLASPQYGPRWGRHWLDVARYGDSNGGDENHAYPNAYRYRNYVVDAFNRDLPFDRFVHEQIAGDLLEEAATRSALPDDTSGPTFGTGFLALGTKILAEKDRVKMRADMIDEQIDTLGKAFFGLTLGCARCHDHKFDPLTTKDYYALAGILHSSEVTETPLDTAAFRSARDAHERRMRKLRETRERVADRLEAVSSRGDVLTREAESFDRGNVGIYTDGYGKGVGIISGRGSGSHFAEYDVDLASAGEYFVQLRYAALVARPGRLLINGAVVKKNAISGTTGSWYPDTQWWFMEGGYSFERGANVLRLESTPLMSHIDRVRLVRHRHQDGNGPYLEIVGRLETIDRQIAEFSRQMPQAEKVMAMRDGEVRDVRIHVRGNHLSPGDEVRRGFPAVLVAGETARVPAGDSGRLQLARWLTAPDTPAAGLTSRVIANRIWHWHFGRGIVATPDNFGTRGQRPTHPLLLDHLARRLVATDWSLKSLHRRIVLASTYRMAGAVPAADRSARTDPSNRLHWRFPRRRLEAEVIRDLLLFHAGRLNLALGGAPLEVKTRDPSPDDLQANRAFYRGARRRSVFLPVVRTNVYEFLGIFDFPNAATPVGRRDVTTLPTQALLLLNDALVMEQAEHLGVAILATSARDDSQRMTDVYVRLFGRPPDSGEVRDGLDFLEAFRSSLAADDDSVRQRSAWAALCHTLIAGPEFIYLP